MTSQTHSTLKRTLFSGALAFALLLSLSLTWEQRAYAYADPGSSLLVFQSLSAIITGGIYYFRRRLKALFHRNTNSGEPR